MVQAVMKLLFEVSTVIFQSSDSTGRQKSYSREIWHCSLVSPEHADVSHHTCITEGGPKGVDLPVCFCAGADVNHRAKSCYWGHIPFLFLSVLWHQPQMMCSFSFSFPQFCTMIITYLALLLKFAITLGASCGNREDEGSRQCTCLENNTLTALCASFSPK